MPRITFVSYDGVERTIDAKTGHTVMETAIANSVPGIDAICGGACACSTCHVYVDPTWIEKTGPQTPAEQDMLGFVSKREATSRLSCQLRVTEALDGLKVHTPESQESQL